MTYGAIRNRGKQQPATRKEEADLFKTLAPADGVPSRAEQQQQFETLPNLTEGVEKVTRAELERKRREAAQG